MQSIFITVVFFLTYIVQVHVHMCVRGHMPDCMCTMMYSVLLYTACEGKEGNISLRVEGRRQREREKDISNTVLSIYVWNSLK